MNPHEEEIDAVDSLEAAEEAQALEEIEPRQEDGPRAKVDEEKEKENAKKRLERQSQSTFEDKAPVHAAPPRPPPPSTPAALGAPPVRAPSRPSAAPSGQFLAELEALPPGGLVASVSGRTVPSARAAMEGTPVFDPHGPAFPLTVGSGRTPAPGREASGGPALSSPSTPGTPARAEPRPPLSAAEWQAALGVSPPLATGDSRTEAPPERKTYASMFKGARVGPAPGAASNSAPAVRTGRGVVRGLRRGLMKRRQTVAARSIPPDSALGRLIRASRLRLQET